MYDQAVKEGADVEHVLVQSGLLPDVKLRQEIQEDLKCFAGVGGDRRQGGVDRSEVWIAFCDPGVYGMAPYNVTSAVSRVNVLGRFFQQRKVIIVCRARVVLHNLLPRVCCIPHASANPSKNRDGLCGGRCCLTIEVHLYLPQKTVWVGGGGRQNVLHGEQSHGLGTRRKILFFFLFSKFRRFLA